MALRLGEYVVYGELYNISHYCTHGTIALRGIAEGDETLMRVELTGDCGPDLRGKAFRFTPCDADPQDAVFRPEDHSGFQRQQIGPTGTMTAEGWVRAMPCSVGEFLHRAELGEPPPTEWKRHLYLEWYSQNGRVVIEMAGPVVEKCLRLPKGEHDQGEWAPLPHAAPRPGPAEPEPTDGPEITLIRVDGDNVHVEQWTPPFDAVPAGDDTEDTIPEALQRELDEESAALDRAIYGEDGDSDGFMREMELIDSCMDHSEGKSLGTLLGDISQLPDPEGLTDDETEAQLKALLARLALFGVALDVCKHFTPRDCYRLLRDTLLEDATAYEELAGTGWVQHVCTYEYCPDCEAEYDAEQG